MKLIFVSPVHPSKAGKASLATVLKDSGVVSSTSLIQLAKELAPMVLMLVPREIFSSIPQPLKA